MQVNKHSIINQLRKEILLMEGFKPAPIDENRFSGLQDLEAAFPNETFPTGTIHEFVAAGEQSSSCLGFMSALLASLMKENGICIWISTSRALFPLSLFSLGVSPERIIFIDLDREREVLWATEEALKCEGLTAVVSELRDIDFAQSRRLQLATEKSKVTGFILRTQSNKISATTCTARWQIKSLPSQLQGGLPGVGFPRWQVELIKVKNGNPASWEFEWSASNLHLLERKESGNLLTEQQKKAG